MSESTKRSAIQPLPPTGLLDTTTYIPLVDDDGSYLTEG